MKKMFKLSLLFIGTTLFSQCLFADIAAAHVYHNHMPNFWPYYDVTQYDLTPIGGEIRYSYDGQVIKKKREGMADVANGMTIEQAKVAAKWPYWIPTTMLSPDGKVIPFAAGGNNNPEKYYNTPMPHDDLGNDGIGPYGSGYYVHHDKADVYDARPPTIASLLNAQHKAAQAHVTMSGSLLNNIQSIRDEGVLPTIYTKKDWFAPWRTADQNLRTTGGNKVMDMVHFTGHHSMGPLMGSDVFLKELIYHNTTLAQPQFFGTNFKSSKGFFPTELGFSERLVPVLSKIGVEWSVAGSTHFARTLTDYPCTTEIGMDLNISPPNKADMQTTDPFGGAWEQREMKNSSGGYQLDGTVRPNMITFVKYPYSAVPGWVRYVDPATGEESKIAAMPVDEASSWLEGFNGSTVADILTKYDTPALTQGRKLFFGIAHDGDNNRGNSGGYSTWANAANVTYKYPGTTGTGIDDYLKNNPIPKDYVIHVQDGSWADTMDSASDPTWNHWRIPMGMWNGDPKNADYGKGSGQWTDFRNVTGLNYGPKKTLRGDYDQYTVSFEYGYNYLERNYALLQAALNYAKTAEQIWLSDHPNYWRPSTAVDYEIVGKNNTGNQLNPYMYSFPVKGDVTNDYKGGANPAELSWYFLTASIDSGFGYYDENIDDAAKPTISFNQSLYFSEPYVKANIAKDKTGPSLYWPQRFPHNPGSANTNKQDGWKAQYFNNVFSVYTYAYDVSGMQSLKVMVRAHRDKTMTPVENACKVYDPIAMQAKGVPNIDISSVGAWKSYDMTRRDLTPDINGVKWQPTTTGLFGTVPAKKIGELCFAYIKDYRDQLLDYYIEAIDTKGNITRSEIQQVYVGIGKYRKEGTYKFIEDAAGTIEGTHPFVTDSAPPLTSNNETIYIESTTGASVVVQYKTTEADWSNSLTLTSLSAPNSKYKSSAFEFKSNTNTINIRYSIDNGSTWLPSITGIKIGSGTNTIYANGNVATGSPAGITNRLVLYYKGTRTYIHWRPEKGTWTVAPGLLMADSEITGYKKVDLDLGLALNAEVCFNTNNTNWDSNGGANYPIPAGTYLFDETASTKITPYNPVTPITTDKLLGDFNGDNSVGITDFIEFSRNYGSVNTNYDIAPATLGTGAWTGIYSKSTPDSKVDINDFIVFANNYSKKTPAATTNSISRKTGVSLQSFSSSSGRSAVSNNNYNSNSSKKLILSDVFAKPNNSCKIVLSATGFDGSSKGFEIRLKYNKEELEFNKDSVRLMDNLSKAKAQLIVKEDIPGVIVIAAAVPGIKGNVKFDGDLIEAGFRVKKKTSIISIESAQIDGFSGYSIDNKGYIIVQ